MADGLSAQSKFTLSEAGHMNIEIAEFLSLLQGGEYQQKILNSLNRVIRARNEESLANQVQKEKSAR